jgi:3-phenylpropionate/trans-cinnamate dioxygenase ferredoxin subunit
VSETVAPDYSHFRFFEIGSVDDFPMGERIYLEIDSQEIVVFNIGGQFFAIGDVCSHDNGPLGDGELDGFQVICPRHGARFDIRDGKAVKLPAVKPIPWFPVRIKDKKVEIGMPE